MKSSPRIDRRLVHALERLDDPHVPIAETHRRLGVVADSLDLPRPNYESVRLLLRIHRSIAPRISRTDALIDLAYYTRSPVHAIEDILSSDSGR